jgi:hypothetical protein
LKGPDDAGNHFGSKVFSVIKKVFVIELPLESDCTHSYEPGQKIIIL